MIICFTGFCQDFFLNWKFKKFTVLCLCNDLFWLILSISIFNPLTRLFLNLKNCVVYLWLFDVFHRVCFYFEKTVFTFCVPSLYLLPTIPVPCKQLHFSFWVCFCLCPFPLLSGMASQICPLHSWIIFLFVSILFCPV